jgi:DNA polymerase-4
MAKRTIMHVDLDAFFVSVEQVLNPELKGKPVVVGGKPDHRGVVAAASYEARAFGVHSAMPLVTATRLCPQAVFIEGNYHRYAEASKKFMAILADFSPFLEPMGIDEAYLDVTGFESLHGTIRNMAVKIKERVKNELGLVASIGIAGNKIVAKVASDHSKPDGLVEVPAGQEAVFFAPQAIGKLPGIGKKTEQVLHGLGIITLGQLANMPLPALRNRFGVYGEYLRQLARGIDDREIMPPAEARSISRETTFDRDSTDREFLMATLRYLAERVGADLRENGRQAKCVAIKVRYGDFSTITRQRTLPQPIDTDEAIFQTAAELLRAALAVDGRAVRLIGTGVSSLSEPGQQLALLDVTDRRLEKLNRAIDRIRDRHGFTAIQTGRTLRLKDVFPESAGEYNLPTPGLSR